MTSSSQDTSIGQWEERGHADDYLVKTSIHCTCCGRMIVRHAWIVGECVFCEPACEQLYQDYWLPRYGDVGP